MILFEREHIQIELKPEFYYQFFKKIFVIGQNLSKTILRRVA